MHLVINLMKDSKQPILDLLRGVDGPSKIDYGFLK